MAMALHKILHKILESMNRLSLTSAGIALTLAVAACETTLDIDVPVNQTLVMTAFFSDPDTADISVYKCVGYNDTAQFATVDEVQISLYVNNVLRTTETIADGSVTATFRDLNLCIGDSVAVEVTADGEEVLSAKTKILQTVEIVKLDTLTSASATDRLTCQVTLSDPASESNYYQIRMLKRTIDADGRETSTAIDGDYYDYLFLVSQTAGIISTSEDNTLGIFNDELIDGRTYTLNFTVEKSLLEPTADDEQVFVDFYLCHLTYDLYTYMAKAEAAADYLILPIFSNSTVYTNVDGGYGIVGSVAMDIRTLEFTQNK